MARTTKPLTNTEIKQAKPQSKVYTFADGHGLQLRIKPNGSKLWLFDYRIISHVLHTTRLHDSVTFAKNVGNELQSFKS